MTKTKAKVEKKAKKSPAKRGSKKPVDLEGLRKQIHQLVGDKAVDLVNSTVSEAGKGHYPAMKYLFEIIGSIRRRARRLLQATIRWRVLCCGDWRCRRIRKSNGQRRKIS